MNFLDQILRITAIKIFKSKESFLVYSYKADTIITAPLIMTQTFNYYGKRIKYEELKTFRKRPLLLIRSDEERLLSAYNKKVLGVKTDWKKRLLLLSNGITSEMSFTQYLEKLIINRRKGRFIDRHFVPLKVLYSKIDTSVEKITIQELLLKYPELANTRLKSSKAVVGNSRKCDLNIYETQLVDEYLELW